MSVYHSEYKYEHTWQCVEMAGENMLCAYASVYVSNVYI